jgi:membrane-bound ClpP family serine protease
MDFQIYLICLGAGLIFTLASALFGHFFDSHHGEVEGSGGHAEAGFDSSDMPGVSAWSPTVISSFITAFGGFGVVFSQFSATRSAFISAPLSLAGGFGIASLVLASLRWVFRRTQGSSESQVASLVGQGATVITPIPADGVGEIAYVQAGTRYTAPARAEVGAPVASGHAVKIVSVSGSQFLVVAE